MIERQPVRLGGHRIPRGIVRQSLRSRVSQGLLRRPGARPASARFVLSALALGLLAPGMLSRPLEGEAQAGAAPVSFALGYNMDFPGDWTNQPPFIDQMKNSREIVGECPDEERECDPTAHLSLDPRGWLTSLRYADDPSRSYESATIILFSGDTRYDLGRTFAITWAGRGELAVEGESAASVQSAGPNRLTFSLAPGLTALRIEAIEEADPLREIRVFPLHHEAALEAGEVFNPDLVDWLRPFKSLRFMDWMQSNATGRCSGGTEPGRACYPLEEADWIDASCGGGGRCVMPGQWSERPAVEQRSWLSWGQFLDGSRPSLGLRVGGYPVEVMVGLANRVGAAPHFNMPVVASEQYIRNFAQLVRDTLDPRLSVSVEYSNEVWNWGFGQAQYANEQGRALWPDVGSAWVQYAAMRTHDMCRIWSEVFEDERGRLRCLISPQTSWLELVGTVLDCPEVAAMRTDVRSCTEYVDAINIAGYFSGCLQLPELEPQVLAWAEQGEAGLEAAFSQLNHGDQVPGCERHLDRTLELYQAHAEFAQARGLDLTVYEGGTHFDDSGENAAVRAFLVEMSTDPRMRDAYLRNFEGLRSAGGDTFNIWGWIEPDDAWANASALGETSHPKYRAAAEFAERWGDTTPLPPRGAEDEVPTPSAPQRSGGCSLRLVGQVPWR